MDYYGLMLDFFRPPSFTTGSRSQREGVLALGAANTLLGWLLAAGLLSACASAPTAQQPGATGSPLQASPPAAQAEAEAEAKASPPAQTAQTAHYFDAPQFYSVLLAELLAESEDARNATALMLDAARHMHSEPLYRRATDIALQARAGAMALQAAQAWQQAFPQSRSANRYELQILLMLNRVQESAQPLSRELAASPPNARTALYLGIAQLYRRVSDKALAAQVVEQALQADLTDPDTAPAAWAMLGHMRLAAEQPSLALEAALQSQRLNPNNGAAALLALELLEGGEYRAESLVQGYLQRNPTATIRLAYARVLMGRQRLMQALSELQTTIAQAPELPDAWLALASVQAQLGQLEQAEQSLQGLLPLLPNIADAGQQQATNHQASLLGARIALQTQQNARAAYWLQRLPEDASDLAVQSLRATVLVRQNQLTQAQALLNAVPVRTTAQAVRKRQARVQLWREAGDFGQAYALQKALQEDYPEDADIGYDAALLAEQVGELEDMEHLLRAVIAQQPDYYHAYNALGYSLADRGERLDEARQLIEKALTFAPDDAYITDSLGWLEYRQGNLALALTLLERAYGIREDVEIAAHLGEVLWAAGQQERARRIWQQAQQRGAANPVLQETLRRLKVQP